MKKIILSVALLFSSCSFLYPKHTVYEKLTIASQLSHLLSKKELLEQLCNTLDSLMEEKRTHPLTMAVIHLLNLGQKPKPSNQPKPTTSKPARFINEEEIIVHNTEFNEAIKAIILALLTQQSEMLDTEITELIDQLKN